MQDVGMVMKYKLLPSTQGKLRALGKDGNAENNIFIRVCQPWQDLN